MTEITIEKRQADYIAYLTNKPEIWESGDSEWEAMGKLCLRCQGRLNIDVEYK